MPRVDVNNYPAIKEHLDQYYEKLEKRDDQGDTPYNLRSCAYMNIKIQLHHIIKHKKRYKLKSIQFKYNLNINHKKGDTRI